MKYKIQQQQKKCRKITELPLKFLPNRSLKGGARKRANRSTSNPGKKCSHNKK